MLKSTDKVGVNIFVDQCYSQGLRQVVCSPGSRNAPLVIAFDSHPGIETFVIHDERSAGFYALGLALGTKRPVAVCCTSGSALLNYFPAVAEAYYQGVPLVVISADRPEEWINHGDGQTIMQDQVYGNHVHAYLSVPEAMQDQDLEEWKHKITSVFKKAVEGWIGPVHFNVPLQEPLYSTSTYQFNLTPSDDLPKKKLTLSDADLALIRSHWGGYAKKMILCGQLNDFEEIQPLVEQFTDKSDVVVLTENTSNIKGVGMIHCIDRTLQAIHPDDLKSFQPDLLITLGGAIVSKKIKAFLRSSRDLEHWRVGVDFPEMDTYRAKRRNFSCDTAEFLRQLLANETSNPSVAYGKMWMQKYHDIQEAIPGFMESLPFCDLKIYHVLFSMLRGELNLHLANSSVVRYAQLFEPMSKVRYFCNRGTSGIDGSTSTACGVSLSDSSVQNVLITGDVSFFYDSNALWTNFRLSNLKIVVINNGGGGIFNIIEGPEDKRQNERFFEARHAHSAEHLAAAFGLTYLSAHDSESLLINAEVLLNSERESPILLEVFTRDIKNEQYLSEFFNHIAHLT